MTKVISKLCLYVSINSLSPLLLYHIVCRNINYMCFTVIFHRWRLAPLCGPNIYFPFGTSIYHNMCIFRRLWRSNFWKHSIQHFNVYCPAPVLSPFVAVRCYVMVRFESALCGASRNLPRSASRRVLGTHRCIAICHRPLCSASLIKLSLDLACMLLFIFILLSLV